MIPTYSLFNLDTRGATINQRLFLHLTNGFFSLFHQYIYSVLYFSVPRTVFLGTASSEVPRSSSVLTKKRSHLSLDAIFCVEVDSREVFIIYEYSSFTYEIYLAIGEKRINDDFYAYYDTLNNEFVYTLLNNRLYASTIKILDNYSPDIGENGFLLFAALMATEGPEAETAACVLITEFQDMEFIKSYSKQAVDEYLNYIKKKIDNFEQMGKDIIPTGAPVNIVYQLGRAAVNQFTTKLFARFPTTCQYSLACLKMTSSVLKTTKSSNFTLRQFIKWESSEFSALKQYGHWHPEVGTSLQDENFQLKGVVANLGTKINQLTNQMRQYGVTKSNNSQYVENNNNNNRRNSNNKATNNKGGGGSGEIIYRGDTSGGGNNNYLQVNRGTI